MHIVSHRGSSLSSTRHPIHACALVRCVVVVLFTRLLFPLRSVALLPALPDVFLRVPQEAQVQRPARLPLGDRGHFRPRDTPHICRTRIGIELIELQRRFGGAGCRHSSVFFRKTTTTIHATFHAISRPEHAQMHKHDSQHATPIAHLRTNACGHEPRLDFFLSNISLTSAEAFDG